MSVIGSPAWAGIDRTGERLGWLGGWFPRVGGDRPPVPGFGVCQTWVPPRGRG